MKLQTAVAGKKHEVEITRDGDKFFARVDDRSYELEPSEPEPNVFLLKHDGRVFEVFVSPQQKTDKPYAVRIGSAELNIKLTDPKRLRGTASGSDDTEGKVEIKTAMPGKVVRILVAKGDNVEAGDGVIVVEAMKMQNEIKSPKDGVIKTIAVAEGDTVSAGQLLAVIE
ncbi:MAG: biotin/lipoyl-containing protein [Pyrinomonadaceae bacterium]